MWKLWSSATPLAGSNHELPDSAISSTSTFSRTSDGLDGHLSVHTITDSPLILPPPPVRICKNSFGQQQHLIISLFVHLLIWVCRSVVHKVRIIIKQRKRALHAENCCKTNISSHHNNYDNDSNSKSISNRFSFGDESNPNQEENSSFCQCDDVEDEDESPIFTKAILQHYVIVWASILTSPKGAQLDSWLMVMVFMDLSPIVWCILCSFHDSVAQRFQRSTTENSHRDESELNTNSNESTQLNSLRIVPSTFMQTAELLSLTMKKWSPAYQLNEMIMKHVDGCIFSHASWLYILTFGVTQIHTALVLTLHCRSYYTGEDKT